MLTQRVMRNADAPVRKLPIRDAGDSQSETRSLVVVNPVQTAGKTVRRFGRCDAPFLAHLMATRSQEPQTREKRRGEPGEANAMYRKTDRRPVWLGRFVSKNY